MKKFILGSLLLVTSALLYGDSSVGFSTKLKHNFGDGIINDFYLTDTCVRIDYFNFGCGILTIPEFHFPLPHIPHRLNQIYLYTGIGVDIPIEKYILGVAGNIGGSFSDSYSYDYSFQFLHGEINVDFLIPISGSYNSYLDLNTGFSTILMLEPINYFFHIGIGAKVFL